jgi:hypothetical protein
MDAFECFDQANWILISALKFLLTTCEWQHFFVRLLQQATPTALYYANKKQLPNFKH